MANDRPKKHMVIAVIESMDFQKTGTEHLYCLSDDIGFTGRVNIKYSNMSGDNIFKTKQELLASLLRN